MQGLSPSTATIRTGGGLVDWDALDDLKYGHERDVIANLLDARVLDLDERSKIVRDATRLVHEARRRAGRQGPVETLLQQYSLSTKEGIALMSLAEALLRTPDARTRDLLIAERIRGGDWTSGRPQAAGLLATTSSWALNLTSRVLVDEVQQDTGLLRRLVARVGEPVVRSAVAAAMGLMGNQFVLGRTIAEALRRAERAGMLCSFDMLGEGARTEADAERYELIYLKAIETVAEANDSGADASERHAVSVKLSALSPRYDAVNEDLVSRDLYPRLLRLARAAARTDMNLTIDAEEADRLVISLKLVDRLAREDALKGWTGLGVVVQAYQTRALSVLDRLHDLSRATGRRLFVRLVKGAYWDTEIKRAQVAGRPGYPVFTSKAATDVNYLACAKRLIAASPALAAQFATHNAHTIAAVRHMAQAAGVAIEHQRLHGMGEGVYGGGDGASARLRAYAPVGSHQDLLPYLVRRLLENGANSSFVHALLDPAVPAENAVRDPFEILAGNPRRNAKIPMPADMYGVERRNPLGRDYSVKAERERASRARTDLVQVHAGPLIGGSLSQVIGKPVRSPGDGRVIAGYVGDASARDVELAVRLAREAQPRWNALGGGARARILRQASDLIEEQLDRLVALLSVEAGKTLNDGVAEVREAIDFCRYYAALAERQFDRPTPLPSPAGETNEHSMEGRGIFACISPWNFPLAIFMGQVVAALAAGNAVLAKPAEQTPLIAFEAVRLLHEAGVEPALVALLPGGGANVGQSLVEHPHVDGVAFTGGTRTANRINRALADRPGAILPFIAETGGLNGLFADTTALREQVVDDAVLSAFGSGGQRCSALRVLFIPHETAEQVIETLRGAMNALRIGDPADPRTDVGPVIDEAARARLLAHVERLEKDGAILHRLPIPEGLHGSYFAPVLAEIPSPDFLEEEVFGPILHICRYDPKDLGRVARLFAARGYGLTLGIHSRLDVFARSVRNAVPAGNVYVNRAMTGAVVGVQPFGGEGLSGTGPKAGGPHALLRYAVERSVSVNIAAQGGDPALLNL